MIVAARGRSHIGLPARLVILVLLAAADKALLNLFVDFDAAQSATGLGAVVRNAQHLAFRFLVASAASVALYCYVAGRDRVAAAAQAIRTYDIRIRWLCVHALLIVGLMPLSFWLYRSAASPIPFAALVALWIALAAAASAGAALAFASARLWLNLGRSVGRIWLYAISTAFLAAGVMQWSQQLWSPTAAITFMVVRHILAPVIPGLIADPVSRILSTDRFSVEIAEVCSGLEGIGLMLAFSIGWLLYFRREYLFPRALLLIPAGVVAIFALNALRIAGLMLIGYSGFPEVAQFGFHSQAGWIAFNLVACALAFWSMRFGWFRAPVATGAPSSAVASAASPLVLGPSAASSPRGAAVIGPATPVAENPPAPYLMPLLAILAAGALSRAFSGIFETLYPLRLIAGASLLIYYRRKLATLDWRFSWRGPAVGIAVFVIWMLCGRLLLPQSDIPAELTLLPTPLRDLWVACRAAASILTVPLAEELAYRGYLMRRLMQPDFEAVPFHRVSWLPMLIAALAFGLAHGSLWLPGILAGVAYGLLVVRCNALGEAVAAHATSNALIAVAVLAGGAWQLW